MGAGCEVIGAVMITNGMERCPCCGEGLLHDALLDGITLLEYITRSKFALTSGCRCVLHNKEVGGSPASCHIIKPSEGIVRSLAADLVVVSGGVGLDQIAIAAANRIPVFISGGVGYYPGHIHLDIRTNGPARWVWFNGQWKRWNF